MEPLLIAVGSVPRGSPGVTTTCLGLHARWPDDRPALLTELDPAGGDIATRFGLAADPGLISLATAASTRRASDAGAVMEHAQLVLDRPVLIGPSRPGATETALAGGVDGLLLELSTQIDVLVDCGRLFPAPRRLAPILRRSAVLLLVVRPRLVELRALEQYMPVLCDLAPRLGLVLVGRGDFAAADIARELGIAVAGELPLDKQGAAVLSGAPMGRGWFRTPLMCDARALAEHLVRDGMGSLRPLSAVGSR